MKQQHSLDFKGYIRQFNEMFVRHHISYHFVTCLNAIYI